MWLVDVDTKVLKKAEDGIRSSLQRVAKKQFAEDPKVYRRMSWIQLISVYKVQCVCVHCFLWLGMCVCVCVRERERVCERV